jgi:uncharacterized protein (TIGR02118 family)
MHKFTIIFRHPENLETFEYDWAHKFVPIAEKMPGILRIEVSTIDGEPDGPSEIHKLHEFYFESREAMDEAMLSDKGNQAGLRLNAIAHNRFSILFSEVHEDILRASGNPPDAQVHTELPGS